MDQPFTTRNSKPYDPVTNSMNIAIGDKFDLGNGYKLTVMEDHIYVEGFGKGSQMDDEKANKLAGGLSSLIHFADQQWFSSMIHEEWTPSVLDFLKDLGVDTSKEFVINGTKCEIRNGRIREVGNKSVVPNSIYQQAVDRYEEHLYKPLRDIYKDRV